VYWREYRHLQHQRPLNNGFRVLSGKNADGQFKGTDMIYATPGYFEALRIPVLVGRAILEADTANSQPVALVNEAFVKKFLRGQEPLGSQLGSPRRR
jgi:hypothetical protein